VIVRDQLDALKIEFNKVTGSLVSLEVEKKAAAKVVETLIALLTSPEVEPV